MFFELEFFFKCLVLVFVDLENRVFYFVVVYLVLLIYDGFGFGVWDICLYFDCIFVSLYLVFYFCVIVVMFVFFGYKFFIFKD